MQAHQLHTLTGCTNDTPTGVADVFGACGPTHSQSVHTQDTDPQKAPQIMWPNAHALRGHTWQCAWPHGHTGHTHTQAHEEGTLTTHVSTQNAGLARPPTRLLNRSALKTGFPGGSVEMNPPAKAGPTGNAGSIPGSGRSPGEGNGNPFQYSCLENSMDRGAWWATVHGVAKNQTRLK